MSSKLPNFFIVGAAKSGTTSVYAYLSQHPDIYLSPLKEPKYFSVPANKFPHNGPGDSKVDCSIVNTWDDYLRQFKEARHEKVIGEASADYLYFNKIVVPSIYEYNPESKILIILRDPVDRAFSAYKHMLKDKRERLSFEDAIKTEGKRMRENFEFIWFYKNVGLYYQQVLNYLNTFNKGFVKICLYDDLTNNSEEVTKDILKFLEVDVSFTLNTSEKHNVSEVKRNDSLNQILNEYDHPLKKLFRPVFLNTLGKNNTEKIVNYIKNKNALTMKPKTRKHLIDIFRDDIHKLEDLIERDLTDWYS